MWGYLDGRLSGHFEAFWASAYKPLAMAFLLGLILWPALRLIASAVAWLRGILQRQGDTHFLTVCASDDNYILANSLAPYWLTKTSPEQDIISKETDLIVRYNGRSARGTIRFTRGQNYEKNTIGLPSEVADKLGLKNLDENPRQLDLRVGVAARFILEKLWNDSDDSIRIGYRTAVWVALITTVTSTIITALFEYVLCRGCISW